MLNNLTTRLARAGVAAVVALAALPAAASAAQCEKVATSKVFAPIGDTNDYFLAPGGDFEGTMTWERTGPVAQRWTHPALPGAGPTGLVMGAGGTVTSPKLCADVLRPTLRFLAYAHNGHGSLRVEALEDGGKAVLLGRLAGASFASGAATGHVSFGTVLGLALDASKHVRLRLTAESGLWAADAVYVDPYMR
ncbi:MAG TPA: hypothetical protein VN213_03440 [Solirubrobacteraceae bacterium]|nr:hypothetical protein [Solirubrobacteraceae bacterium]